MKTNDLRKTKAITLIALIVTIVVLLILAGVSIAVLTGENGIISRTSASKTTSKLAEIEEQANLILLNSKVDLHQGNTPATILEMVEELRSKGYTIDRKTTGGDAILDINVSSKMKMTVSSTATINVNLVENPNSAADYYAVEGGKYYKMYYGTDKVTIDKIETDVSALGNELADSLTAQIKTGSTGTGISIGTISGTSIPLNSTSSATGTTTIVVNYGDFSKECDVTIGVIPTYVEGNESIVDFARYFGTIEVIWLNGTGTTTADVTDTPNSPATHLAGMTPVKFGADGTITPTTTSDSSWYSYNAGGIVTANGLPDNNTSNWANAQNTDESLFVWIPRFAYRITYYEDWGTWEYGSSRLRPKTQPSGYYDGYGMWKATTGEIKYPLEDNIKTIEYNGEKYIIHPAFCNGETDGYDEGQWSSALEGFWVAKYKMSKEIKNDNIWGIDSNNSGGNIQVGETIRAVSKPEKFSWRNLSIGNCFYNGLHYAETDSNFENDSIANSHIMKNSEWGAVAYLTHSQYGRNATEITANDSSRAGNEGILSSSTGNYYGIYDLAGTDGEYVAVFASSDKNGYIPSYGWSNLSINTSSNAYATKYNNNTESSKGDIIYIAGKTGDAIKEVTRHANNGVAWYGDYCGIIYKTFPFSCRGGVSYKTNGNGVFTTSANTGCESGYSTFRVVLAQ